MDNMHDNITGDTEEYSVPMSPEEESWLFEQLEMQLAEASLADMTADMAIGFDGVEVEDGQDYYLALTDDEQHEFDAWVEAQGIQQKDSHHHMHPQQHAQPQAKLSDSGADKPASP